LRSCGIDLLNTLSAQVAQALVIGLLAPAAMNMSWWPLIYPGCRSVSGAIVFQRLRPSVEEVVTLIRARCTCEHGFVPRLV